MAQKRNRKNKSLKDHPYLAAILLLLLIAFYLIAQEDGMFPWLDADIGGGIESGTEVGEDSDFQITYLDVGQADCSILQCDGQSMIIDAGNNADSGTVLSALEELGIDKLDYVIATHSHEDHIGAMDEVLLAIPADYIIYYKEDSETRTYRNFLNAVEENGATYIAPELLKEFSFGSAKVQIISPSESVCTDPNNSSVSVLITYGKNKFLFTGDAEEKSEKAMLALGISLEADVFQAGHHGSNTANSEAFLKAVDPVYVIISCGENNKYGHPHAEMLARLEDEMVYRTDTMGTITLVSDGKNISISTANKNNQ